MNHRHLLPLLLASALAFGPARVLRADDSTSSIAFSDPGKPGTLKIRLFHGDVRIQGADVKEISVRSDANARQPTPRKDGMRILSDTPGYELTEKDNVAVLDYTKDESWSNSADFEITVPKNTNIIVSNTTHGDLTVRDIAGDIDVRRMGGEVRLEDISGGALVSTMSGDVIVKVKELTTGHPLSFNSLHGEIRLQLPAAAKANLRFRTHRGTILTNFDDKSLVTKTEVARPARVKDKVADGDAAPAAPAAPAPDAPPAPTPPKTVVIMHNDSDDNGDWRDDVRDEVREAAREAAEAAREAADAVREGLEEAHIELHNGIATLPPMTGGKVVSGTLNGGGVSIEAATLNGDITLKKTP